MGSSVTSADRLIASRYECKYLVSRRTADEIRRRIAPFVVPDRYAARHVGNRYTISSLYLDSADLALYQQTAEGIKNRFKLRIRAYSDDPELPVYFETKKRINTVVSKRRGPVLMRDACAWLGDGRGAAALQRIGAPPAAIEFADLVRVTRAGPIARVRYVREAYESSGLDPVRITLDTDLMYAITTDATLGMTGGKWWPGPVAEVILEIKFTERFPSWVRGLIDTLQLQKQSVPKYASAVSDALASHRYSPGRNASLSAHRGQHGARD